MERNGWDGYLTTPVTINWEIPAPDCNTDIDTDTDTGEPHDILSMYISATDRARQHWHAATATASDLTVTVS